MSFRCDLTGEQSKVGDKEIRIVAETRDAEYRDDPKDKNRVTGVGREVAKELRLTVAGLRIWVDGNPWDSEAAELLAALEKPATAQKPVPVSIGKGYGGKHEFMLSGCFSASKGMMG